MLITHPYPTVTLAEQPVMRPSVFIPTVYEKETPSASHWEYHIVTIDTRETAVPDAQQLNELGKEGWFLVGILDERATGRSSLVYYYFTRQIQ